MKFKNEAVEYEQLEEGTYPARCIGLIDLGTQTHEKFGTNRMIYVPFEIIDEEREDGSPFIMGMFMTVKFSPKSTLGKTLKTWFGIEVKQGDDYHFEEFDNAAAMVTVQNKANEEGEEKSKIITVARVPKKMKVGEAQNEFVEFSLDDFNKSVFNELPEWLQDRIKESEEWATIGKGKAKKVVEEDEDEEEEETPKAKSNGKAKKVVEPEDEDEDEEEEIIEDEDEEGEEEEEETPRKRTATKTKKVAAPPAKSLKKFPKRKK